MSSSLRIGTLLLAGLGFLLWLANHSGALKQGKPGETIAGREASSDLDRGNAETIRIASFNIQAFGHAKLEKPHVMQVLVDVARKFDVIAIQEIRSRQQDVLPRFVKQLNGDRYQYDFAVSRRLGRTNSQEQYAFIYDTQRIEIDHRYADTVVDRGDRLHREPFVAAFRVRGPPPDQAFTFTLINIHTDPDEVRQELSALYDVYRAVQRDGRGEDDIILLGDLNASVNRLGDLGRLPFLSPAITESRTNTRRTEQYDNILYHSEATSEFTGRCGVVDLQREYGLTLQQALEVSDHLPVWAEFSAYEGGKPGYVAGQNQLRR